MSLGLFFSLTKKETSLVVNFLDVGQGDAILIRTPQGQNILIDGGPDNILLSEVAKVLPWWERKIDYLIITHFHADHMMGFIEVLNKYEVDNILVTSHQPDDFLYNIWTKALGEHNLEPTIVEAGERLILEEDLYWQVLLADDYHEDHNDNSLVIRLSFKEIDFLFMGDLPTKQEGKILAHNFIIQSEVIKVGHHGSKYSSGPEFLNKVKPALCIIQSGLDNKFGHPHQEAVDRFNEIGCQIKDNQLAGTITVLSDGQDWWLK